MSQDELKSIVEDWKIMDECAVEQNFDAVPEREGGLDRTGSWEPGFSETE